MKKWIDFLYYWKQENFETLYYDKLLTVKYAFLLKAHMSVFLAWRIMKFWLWDEIMKKFIVFVCYCLHKKEVGMLSFYYHALLLLYVLLSVHFWKKLTTLHSFPVLFKHFLNLLTTNWLDINTWGFFFVSDTFSIYVISV